MKLEVVPVTGIGDVEPGADLAALITDAAPWLADGDVLVVTSKIVSKAEGRLVDDTDAGSTVDGVATVHRPLWMSDVDSTAAIVRHALELAR